MIDVKKLKIGITLSGGGVRAAVFHLGVLSRLANDGLLENIKMISTVSGGTLVTGLIFHANGNRWPTSEEFVKNCYPYIKRCLVNKNLQLNIILRTIFFPFPHIGKGRASIVAEGIRRCWGINSSLNDIPEFPRWIINGTTIESGKNWRFIPQNRMGDYILNYVKAPDLLLSKAMGASAGVPMLLGPLKINTARYKWFKYEHEKEVQCDPPPFKKIHIWDGGAYDNLGIESLLKYSNGLTYRNEINFLLVSDAALEVGTSKRKWYNMTRLIDVTMDQVRALRARSLWDHFGNNKNSGVYFKIGDTIEKIRGNYQTSKDINLTSTGLTANRIKELKTFPTTLWKMKENDFTDLYQHGWEVANGALVSQCPNMFINQLR
jgi:NTE family protein